MSAYPICGHSACRQNFIDTGSTACVSAPVDVLAVADVITRDCGYGFSGHAVMDDGSSAFHTTRLHPTREEAAKEVAALARVGGAR